MLPRNKTDPGRQMAPVLEFRAVADGGDDRRGGLWADALDLGNTLTVLVLTEES